MADGCAMLDAGCWMPAPPTPQYADCLLVGWLCHFRNALLSSLIPTLHPSYDGRNSLPHLLFTPCLLPLSPLFSSSFPILTPLASHECTPASQIVIELLTSGKLSPLRPRICRGDRSETTLNTKQHPPRFLHHDASYLSFLLVLRPHTRIHGADMFPLAATMADIIRALSPTVSLIDPSPFGSDSDDAVSLSEILEFCNVAQLQEFALRIPPSVLELQRYEIALRRYTSSRRVRQQIMYEREAFGWTDDEKTSYLDILDEALKSGVPDTQLVVWSDSTSSWWEDKTPLPGHQPPVSEESPLSPPLTPRKPSFARSSFATPRAKILKGVAVLVSGSRPTSAVPEPDASIPSLTSTNSQISQTPLMKMHARKDSLAKLWRLPKRASTSPEIDSQYDIVLDGARSMKSFSSRVDTTVITPPTSSRSSLNMPPGLHLFSNTDRVLVLEAMQSNAFVELQRNCDCMANQFIEYATIANAALSLLCGRFLCIMDRHVKKCTQEEMKRLEEKVSTFIKPSFIV